MQDPTSVTALASGNGNGQFGLNGMLKAFGNASAMAVMLACFVWMLWGSEQRAREDRALCREQIKELRQSINELIPELRRK